MMKTTENTWENFAAAYRALPLEEQFHLRDVAVQELLSYGVDEIGSSDVTHQLKAIWAQSGCSFSNI